jgi:RNA recognition motif-containing protein
MSNKIFVGGLSWNTNDDTLRRAFEAHGQVDEARVIQDRETGRSRGFGFVTFSDGAGAQRAIASMNGTDLDGRAIKVNAAEDKPRSSGGGGGGGFGGRGGGGGRSW